MFMWSIYGSIRYQRVLSNFLKCQNCDLSRSTAIKKLRQVFSTWNPDSKQLYILKDAVTKTSGKNKYFHQHQFVVALNHSLLKAIAISH